MGRFRNSLPQLNGNVYLTDAGLETDLIFNRGIEIPEFAAHTLLGRDKDREVVANYLRDFLVVAKEHKTGFILDTQTWKAHRHWASDLGVTVNELKDVNEEAVRFISTLRQEFSENEMPIVLSGVIGPKGDAYAPDAPITALEAEEYHLEQIGWLADTNVDMISAYTFIQAREAIGAVKAAQNHKIPIVISFTVETDGNLPSGQSLIDAICTVDYATDNGAAYFMINCAHPVHFSHLIEHDVVTRRIRGIRCNASRMSHAELDCCETLDDGNPVELASQYGGFKSAMNRLNVFGGCCGSDLRHMKEIANVLVPVANH